MTASRSTAGSAWTVAALVIGLAQTACVHRGVTPIRTHFNKGVYHYSQGDFEAAISAYRLALEDDAGDHRARFNLAEALESLADRLERTAELDAAERWRREAEDHYRRLLADDPDHLRANVNLAAREVQQGDAQAADARLRATLARHPRSLLPRVALAAHRLHAGDSAALDEAARLLDEALRRDPGNVDANVLAGHVHAARVAALDGEERNDLVELARQAYRRALSSDASDVGALLALADLEREADRPEAALPWLRRALDVQPDLQGAHLALSEILISLGNLEQATVHLWRARQLEGEGKLGLAPEEYRRRLLELYRRLAELEESG